MLPSVGNIQHPLYIDGILIIYLLEKLNCCLGGDSGLGCTPRYFEPCQLADLVVYKFIAWG